MFSCEFCEISENTFFTEQSGRLLLLLTTKIALITDLGKLLSLGKTQEQVMYSEYQFENLFSNI